MQFRPRIATFLAVPPSHLALVLIDGNTKLVALLGRPVEHTRSPLIHNTAFEAQGLNYRYLAFSVAPDDVAAALRGLTALGFLGANVTIPHKQAVLSLVDELSTAAAAVRAVNTIVVRGTAEDHFLRGENTDINGFLAPLAPFVEDLRTKPVLIFGCGGAARAAAYGILSVVRPPLLWMSGRNTSRCEEMLAELLEATPGAPEVRVVPDSEARQAVAESGLIVNCTPMGMHPNEDTTPWETAADFNPGHVVYDLVYNPLETRLLRDAGSRGATPINGLEMLIQQASASYRLWTGRQMPLEPVRAALVESAR